MASHRTLKENMKKLMESRKRSHDSADQECSRGTKAQRKEPYHEQSNEPTTERRDANLGVQAASLQPPNAADSGATETNQASSVNSQQFRVNGVNATFGMSVAATNLQMNIPSQTRVSAYVPENPMGNPRFSDGIGQQLYQYTPSSPSLRLGPGGQVEAQKYNLNPYQGRPSPLLGQPPVQNSTSYKGWASSLRGQPNQPPVPNPSLYQSVQSSLRGQPSVLNPSMYEAVSSSLRGQVSVPNPIQDQARHSPNRLGPINPQRRNSF